MQGLAWNQTTEIGPRLSLPDGRAFCIGGNGQTGVFDPSNAATSWTAGAALLPSNTGNTLNPTKMATDAPCCLLPNGLVLVCGGEPVNIPNAQGVNQTWSGSPVFYLYDPKANAMTTMPANGGQDVNTQAQNTWECCLLLLPTGQVLLSTGHNELWIMTLDSSVNTPDNGWRPIVDLAPSIMVPGSAYTRSKVDSLTVCRRDVVTEMTCIIPQITQLYVSRMEPITFTIVELITSPPKALDPKNHHPSRFSSPMTSSKAKEGHQISEHTWR